MHKSWHFYYTFVHSKCKQSSLRLQYWMRLFLWFSNTVLILESQSFIITYVWKESVRRLTIKQQSTEKSESTKDPMMHAQNRLDAPERPKKAQARPQEEGFCAKIYFCSKKKTELRRRFSGFQYRCKATLKSWWCINNICIFTMIYKLSPYCSKKKFCRFSNYSR